MHSTPNPDFCYADGQGYWLSRGQNAAVCRLTLQALLWRRALGFDIDPSIQLERHSAIADVAAGTGIWLSDVSHLYPEAQLDGFDIDLTQAPHEQWLPSNINISYWNVFEEPPPHAIGKYDLVHVRLLVLALGGADDGRRVIRNLFRIIKPNGILQWDDVDGVNTRVKYADPANPMSAPATEQIREICWSKGKYDWLLGLPDILSMEGFTDTRLQKFDDPSELVRAFGEQHLLTMEEFASHMEKTGKAEQAARILQLIGQGYQEMLRGAALCIPRFVCVARKSSSL